MSRVISLVLCSTWRFEMLVSLADSSAGSFATIILNDQFSTGDQWRRGQTARHCCQIPTLLAEKRIINSRLDHVSAIALSHGSIVVGANYVTGFWNVRRFVELPPIEMSRSLATQSYIRCYRKTILRRVIGIRSRERAVEYSREQQKLLEGRCLCLLERDNEIDDL